MSPQQKEALLALGSSAGFALLAHLLQGLLPGFRWETVMAATVVFILTMWIGRWIVGMRARALDERDLFIRYQAGLVASHALGIVSTVGTIILCSLYRNTLTVPTIQVALLAYYGWLSMYAVWSVTVLALYRRGT
jgi:hypothetical protein